MPSNRIDFTVTAALHDAVDACKEAAQHKKWSMRRESPTRLQLGQRMRLASWPIRIDVSFAPAGEHETAIRADGRVGGYGPIQKRALQNALNSLQEEVLRVLPQRNRDSASAGAESQVQALTALAQLRSQGALTDDEFATQKAKILNGD